MDADEDKEKAVTPEHALDELKQASHDLKDKIEELRRKSAMPLNPALGNPKIDADNADGHNDLPPEDDD